MIPKIIHFYWDGDKAMDITCMQTWKKQCPEYLLIHWNNRILPFDKYPKLKILANAKRYSMLSDFLRHWALWEFGGFYLDTDIDLIKSLDVLRGVESFTCIEGYPIAGNSAACGAMPRHWFQKRAMDLFLLFDFEKLLNEPSDLPPEIIVSPQMITRLLVELKGSELTDIDLHYVQTYEKGFTTLPKYFFYPYNYNEKFTPDCIKNGTIGIHHWAKTWAT